MTHSMRSAGGSFVLPAFLFFFSQTARCQWPNDPEIDALVQQGIDEIYNFEFEKAERTLHRSFNSDPTIRSAIFSKQ